jgi:hypothetical protein
MRNLITFLLQWLGFKEPITQTSEAERDCIARHAVRRKRIAEIGVFQGVTTRRLREVMHPEGVLFAIDPFYKNRLGVCLYKMIAAREVGG